jgi:hypothetical protein
VHDAGAAYDASLSDDERRAILYGRGSPRLTDAEAAEQRREDAYQAFKARLGSRNKRYANVGSYGPPYDQQPLPHGMRRGDGGSPPAQVNPNDAAAAAYDARNRWLENRWRDHRGKDAGLPATTGIAAAWSDGLGSPPTVGSFAKTSGFSPYGRS